ncbi:MAG: DUF1492 domain-containing protein [bacterium]|nr:DUF1492 domain-containing protein [bacterium]
MPAKQYLGQLKKLDEKIRQKREKLQNLKECTKSTGSVDVTKERVDGGKVSTDATYVDTLIQIEKLDKEISEMIKEYNVYEREIKRHINILTNEVYITLLRKRYVEFKTLSQIAKEMNYSYDYARFLHGKALKAFEIETTKKNVRCFGLTIDNLTLKC